MDGYEKNGIIVVEKIYWGKGIFRKRYIMECRLCVQQKLSHHRSEYASGNY